MSLVITTYVPEGIVMASDSRQSIVIERKSPEGRPVTKVETVNSDNVYKTFLLKKSNETQEPIFEVEVGFFGQDLLGGISTTSHVKRFIEEDLGGWGASFGVCFPILPESSQSVKVILWLSSVID